MSRYLWRKLGKICLWASSALLLVGVGVAAIVYWQSEQGPITPVQAVKVLRTCPVFTEAGNDVRVVIGVSKIVRGDHSIPSLYYADVAWRPERRVAEPGAVYHSDVSFSRAAGGTSWRILDFSDFTEQHKPTTVVDTEGRCPALKD